MAFSDNVSILERDGKTFYIVGTAHVSQKSVDEVREVVREVKPDTVCVELCETRYKTLMDDSQWKKLNIIEVLKQGKALMLLSNLALSSFQKKIGEKLGVKPGAELMAAVETAEEVDARLVLADRDIQVTLKRTWRNLPFWKKMMALGGLVESVFTREEISEEELEKLKERDQLSDMMQEFAKVMPEVKEPLIDERDRFLMSKIEEAEGETIVAVVGAGHVEGMKQSFGQTIDREAINQLPPPSMTVKVLKWLIPAIILSLFAYGYYQRRDESLEQMFWAWILPNSVLTGLFTLLGGGKLVSAIVGVLAAPITSLNPTIGAGMVVGLVEAFLRKPTVADCERIPEDIKTWRGFFRNPFTKVLLIFFLATLGSAIGTFIGGAWLASIVVD